MKKTFTKKKDISATEPGSDEQAQLKYTIQRYINLIWRIYNHKKCQNPENIDESGFKS